MVGYEGADRCLIWEEQLVGDHPARLLSATSHQENQSNYKDKLQIMLCVVGIAVGKNYPALTLVLTNK